jgi:hypothetical protein
MNAISKTLPSQTIHYDEMCRAIGAAHWIDEVKHIRDKARAIEVYSQMALGEMLSEREKPKRGPDIAGQGSQRATSEQTLADIGISKSESSRYQQLAAVPQASFETALAAPGKKATMGASSLRLRLRSRSTLSRTMRHGCGADCGTISPARAREAKETPRSGERSGSRTGSDLERPDAQAVTEAQSRPAVINQTPREPAAT